jgi:hypothetical protein
VSAYPVIELTHEPSYWAALGALPSAVRALMVADDPDPYRAYWQTRTGCEPHLASAAVLELRALVRSITDGFDPDVWRTDPRGFDLTLDGFGPIVVTRSGETIHPRDGSRRASILRVLGRPIWAAVWSRP